MTEIKVDFCDKCNHDTIQARVKVFYRMTNRAEGFQVLTKESLYDGDDYSTEYAWLCPNCGSYYQREKGQDKMIAIKIKGEH